MTFIIIRDLKKAKAVADSIKKETGEDIQVEYLDLADLEIIKQFAKKCLKETRIDILVNNAGLFMPSKGFSTKQGFEVTQLVY